MLSSDEWVLMKPDGGFVPLIGDSLVIEAATDVDSIVFSWGDNVKFYQRLNEIN